MIKWGLSTSEISSLTYVNIKMALRRYDCPTVPIKALSHIAKSTNISTFRKPICANSIRSTFAPVLDVDTITPLNSWKRALDYDSLDWGDILYYNRFSITNNFKLIQFQYKLLMNISTCRLMRWKMHIDKDNGNCDYCNVPESLNHIFLQCTESDKFVINLNRYLRDNCNIDPDFSDYKRFYFIS